MTYNLTWWRIAFSNMVIFIYMWKKIATQFLKINKSNYIVPLSIYIQNDISLFANFSDQKSFLLAMDPSTSENVGYPVKTQLENDDLKKKNVQMHKDDVQFDYTSSCLWEVLMSYWHYFCLFAYSGAQHILRCVCYFLCPRLVCPMLPVFDNSLTAITRRDV